MCFPSEWLTHFYNFHQLLYFSNGELKQTKRERCSMTQRMSCRKRKPSVMKCLRHIKNGTSILTGTKKKQISQPKGGKTFTLRLTTGSSPFVQFQRRFNVYPWSPGKNLNLGCFFLNCYSQLISDTQLISIYG